MDRISSFSGDFIREISGCFWSGSENSFDKSLFEAIYFDFLPFFFSDLSAYIGLWITWSWGDKILEVSGDLSQLLFTCFGILRILLGDRKSEYTTFF